MEEGEHHQNEEEEIQKPDDVRGQGVKGRGESLISSGEGPHETDVVAAYAESSLAHVMDENLLSETLFPFLSS